MKNMFNKMKTTLTEYEASVAERKMQRLNGYHSNHAVSAADASPKKFDEKMNHESHDDVEEQIVHERNDKTDKDTKDVSLVGQRIES